MLLTKERLRLYLCGLLFLQLVACAKLFPVARMGLVDFRTFYTTGHMLRTGNAIYDYEAEKSAQSTLVSPIPLALPFMFPPFAALLFVPLALGSYLTGYFLFFALNLCFCGLALAVMRPYTASLDALWRPLAPLLFLSFMPLGIALMFGQVSILLLLLYCACFAALQSGRPFLAGILLCITLMKFQIALPIALLFFSSGVNGASSRDSFAAVSCSPSSRYASQESRALHHMGTHCSSCRTKLRALRVRRGMPCTPRRCPTCTVFFTPFPAERRGA